MKQYAAYLLQPCSLGNAPTSVPELPASTMRGAMRSLLGRRSLAGDEGATSAGRLILLAQRSAIGSYCWITSRKLLTGLVPGDLLSVLPQHPPGRAAVQPLCQLLHHGKYIGEGFSLECLPEPTTVPVAHWCAKHLISQRPEWEPTREKLQKDILIVADEFMDLLLSSGRTIRERRASRTEAIPAESIVTFSSMLPEGIEASCFLGGERSVGQGLSFLREVSAL